MLIIYIRLFDKEKHFIIFGSFYKSSDNSEDYVLNLWGELGNSAINTDIGSLDRSNNIDIKEQNAIEMTLRFLSNHNEICRYIQNTGLYGIEPIDFEERYSYMQNHLNNTEMLGFTLYGNKPNILKFLSDNKNIFIIKKLM